LDKRSRVPEAGLLLEILIKLPVVLALLFPGLFLVWVRLMDHEILGKNIVINARDVNFKEAGLDLFVFFQGGDESGVNNGGGVYHAKR